MGQLVAAELIVAAIASRLAKSPKLLDHLYDLLTSLDKLGHVLDHPIDDQSNGEPLPNRGPFGVELRNLPGQGAPILKIEAGARLAMTGAERAPLAEWLAGLRTPPQGAVLIDGVATSHTPSTALRDRVALLTSDDLFDGSVLENVVGGRPTVSVADARAALAQVGLLDDLQTRPEGLETHLASTGRPLSHSQAVQVLVARAIAGAPQLIVVNLALESLEPVPRQRCIDALTRPNCGWTLVALVPDANGALAGACARGWAFGGAMTKEAP